MCHRGRNSVNVDEADNLTKGRASLFGVVSVGKEKRRLMGYPLLATQEWTS